MGFFHQFMNNLIIPFEPGMIIKKKTDNVYALKTFIFLIYMYFNKWLRYKGALLLKNETNLQSSCDEHGLYFFLSFQN